ncbi:MAG: YraN family protein [Alphaproteobacteria bacterium]|jgi:putative endonuclease
MTRRREDAETLGRRAETVAVWLLRLKGYGILARRERTPAGEIDIVARRGRTLVAIEVKARRGPVPLRDLIGEGQWRRIERALEMYAGRRRLGHLRLRFDMVFLCPGRWPHHVADAWRPS